MDDLDRGLRGISDEDINPQFNWGWHPRHLARWVSISRSV